MRKLGALSVILVAVVAALAAARAGHEMPIYPSYYPEEIRIQPMDPARAARALAEGKIQAYVGGEPTFAGAPGETVQAVERLAAYLVVDVDPALAATDGDERACAVARSAVAGLDVPVAGFRFHPYPVTAYHGGYLHHFDLAAAARRRVPAADAGAEGLAVGAEGAMAEALVARRWAATKARPDATVREVGLDALLAPERTAINGWLGPPWLKAGWFHAYRLLTRSVSDRLARDGIEGLVGRLKEGAFTDEAQRINVERDLVRLLTGGCRRVVVGYRLAREYYGAEYSGGVENIAADSHVGFNSAIFLRTVKLKDFPWNGWLALGIDGRPEAAWNPIAGFTDAAGRLAWWALGDPALFPEPRGTGWTPNRIGSLGPVERP